MTAAYGALCILRTNEADREIDAFLAECRSGGASSLGQYLGALSQDRREVESIVSRHRAALANYNASEHKPTLNATLEETRVAVSWYLSVVFSRRGGRWLPTYFDEFSSPEALTIFPAFDGFIDEEVRWADGDQDLTIALYARPATGLTQENLSSVYLFVKNRGRQVRSYLAPSSVDGSSCWKVTLANSEGVPVEPSTRESVTGIEAILPISPGVTHVYALSIPTFVDGAISAVAVSYDDTEGRADGRLVLLKASLGRILSK